MKKRPNDKLIRIGFSVDEKRFMVKVEPQHPAIEKTIRMLGRADIEFNSKRAIWYIKPSMINAIKIDSNIATMAELKGYTVDITMSFKAKKELLQANIHIGKNNTGVTSKYAVQLNKKRIPRQMDKVMTDYQKEAYHYIVKNNGRALIADEMGLGKTLEVLSFIKAYTSIERIVIISPKTIKHVWDAECTKWGVNDLRWIIDEPPYYYDLDYKMHRKEDGSMVVRGKALRAYNFRITIINYERVAAWLPILKHWKPQLVICDEIHKIKNRKAARTKATEALAYKAKFVIGLTGTPVANSPMELFTIANLIRHDMFDYTNYNYRYCGGEGQLCRTAHNADELHSIMTNSIMLRRLKKDVMKELPPKRHIQVELEIDMTSYDAIIEQWVKEADAESTAMGYEAMLRKCIARDKIPALLEWVDKFLEDTGRKIIIFAHHKIVRDMLKSHYGEKAVYIEGGVSDNKRKEAEYRFQNDDSIRVFIGSITASSEGLTLTAASDVCMAESIYNPKTMEQAEDRAHRKGQESHVTVWNLICTSTYEVDTQKLLDEKRIMSAQVVDGATKQMAEVSIRKEVIYNLVNMINERKYS